MTSKDALNPEFVCSKLYMEMHGDELDVVVLGLRTWATDFSSETVQLRQGDCPISPDAGELTLELH
jgi:hypothetical protein